MLVLCCLALSCVAWSYLILSCLCLVVLICLVLSCRALSCLVLSWCYFVFLLRYFVLSLLVLVCLVLSCIVLLCLALSCLIVSSESCGIRLVPWRLAYFHSFDITTSFWSMLLQLSIDQKDVVIVGGGFLGTELACAMNKRSKEAGLNVTPRPGKKQRQITHIMPEPGVLYRCLPRYLSDNTAMQMSQAGVDMRTNTVVTGLSRDPSTGVLVVELTVRTLGHLRRGPGSATARWFDTRKYTLKTDHVIFCTGIKPEVYIWLEDEEDKHDMRNERGHIQKTRQKKYTDKKAKGKETKDNDTGHRLPLILLYFRCWLLGFSTALFGDPTTTSTTLTRPSETFED